MIRRQTILSAFHEDPMCFIHVLLNSLDPEKHQLGGRIVIEEEAVKLVPLMSKENHFLHGLYRKVLKKNVIEGGCKACSAKLTMTDAMEQQNIALIGDMAEHPSMGQYIGQGFTVLTF